MKKSLIVFNYIEVAFLRLIIAFIILLPFLKHSIKKLNRKLLMPLLIVSIIGTVLPAVLFAFSQTYLDSASSGMLNALTPIFTLIIGIILFKKHCNNYNLTGVLIGLAGSYVLINPSSSSIIATQYSLLIIVATICYAISINTIKEKLRELNSLDIAVLSSFLSFLIPMLYMMSNHNIINTGTKILHHPNHFYYLIILGLICTSGAIILFNYLIKRTSALFGSSTTYLIPVFAIFWGILDHENIQKHEISGLVIILLGVFIMNYKNAE